MTLPRSFAVAVVATLVLHCGGAATGLEEPAADASSASSETLATEATATAIPDASAAPATQTKATNEVILRDAGFKMTLPTGWNQKPSGDGVFASSPSGKSALIVYASAGGTTDRMIDSLHELDAAVGVSVPVGLGKTWTTKSGLRYMRSETPAKTKKGENAATFMLLGGAPAKPGTPAGVVAVAVEGDGTAKADLEAAFETLAPL